MSDFLTGLLATIYIGLIFTIIGFCVRVGWDYAGTKTRKAPIVQNHFYYSGGGKDE